RPEARTAPRSTGARRRVVAEEASPHQSHPRRDYTASPIPESKSREISKFCGTGRELAWRVSDRTDHSRDSAAAVPERSGVRRLRRSYIGRIVTRLPVTFGGRRETPPASNSAVQSSLPVTVSRRHAETALSTTWWLAREHPFA